MQTFHSIHHAREPLLALRRKPVVLTKQHLNLGPVPNDLRNRFIYNRWFFALFAGTVDDTVELCKPIKVLAPDLFFFFPSDTATDQHLSLFETNIPFAGHLFDGAFLKLLLTKSLLLIVAAVLLKFVLHWRQVGTGLGLTLLLLLELWLQLLHIAVNLLMMWLWLKLWL